MTYDDFNALCGALPATNYVVQWGGVTCVESRRQDFRHWRMGGWRTGLHFQDKRYFV